jgi:hypothetical protein
MARENRRHDALVLKHVFKKGNVLEDHGFFFFREGDERNSGGAVPCYGKLAEAVVPVVAANGKFVLLPKLVEEGFSYRYEEDGEEGVLTLVADDGSETEGRALLGQKFEQNDVTFCLALVQATLEAYGVPADEEIEKYRR